jgi:hypothetical protein
MSNLAESTHFGPPKILAFEIPYALLDIIRFKVTFVAVKMPPDISVLAFWLPVVFGLTVVTSKVGEIAAVGASAGACPGIRPEAANINNANPTATIRFIRRQSIGNTLPTG